MLNVDVFLYDVHMLVIDRADQNVQQHKLNPVQYHMLMDMILNVDIQLIIEMYRHQIRLW